MSPNYCCPSCGDRLRDAGAANAWACDCGEIVVEAVDDSAEMVREFYRRATGRWGGLRA